MILSIRTRIFGAYLLVLALGGLLAALVFSYGEDVLRATRVLLDEDVPRLEQIADLQNDILLQEKLLYEYYATRDRTAFLKDYQHSDSVCAAQLSDIARPFGDSQEFGSAQKYYEQLRGHALALDRTLAAARTDWDEARRLLALISAGARRINAELETLATRIRARVAESGRQTEASVARTRTVVLSLSIAIFAVSLFVGYYVNAYMREQIERRRLAMFPERNPHPVLSLTADGAVAYANPGVAALLSDMNADPMRPEALLPPEIHEQLSALKSASVPYDRCEYSIGPRTLECGIQWLADLEVFHVYISDISERKRAEERLVHQAYHNPLTNLPNRRMFQEQIAQVLYGAPRAGSMRAAIVLIGLDRFMVVTGSLGHAFADALLQAVGERLVDIARHCHDLCNGHTVHHFEGALFALLVPHFRTADTPLLVAERFIERMGDPLYVQGREYFASFSIGISIYPLDGQDGMTLLRNADTAMQRAREAGGGNLQCYTRDMNAHAAERLALENQLRHALEHDELKLYYQPQVEVTSGRVIGMEALIRWQHRGRGLIAPAEFIPLAEESGTILPIGEWTLRTACAQNRAWQRQGLGKLVVAVNISARQFHQQDLPRLVSEILADTGLEPALLELEITEGTAMQDVDLTTSVLQALREIGVKLSVDDFGTGFSSLSYLKRFPIDKLKVDQSFIRNLTSDENDAAITRAVITLGHSLQMRVIAEGVETEAQLARLQADRCDEYQGYLYSRPLPADEFERLLRRPSAKAAN